MKDNTPNNYTDLLHSWRCNIKLVCIYVNENKYIRHFIYFNLVTAVLPLPSQYKHCRLNNVF